MSLLIKCHFNVGLQRWPLIEATFALCIGFFVVKWLRRPSPQTHEAFGPSFKLKRHK